MHFEYTIANDLLLSVSRDGTGWPILENKKLHGGLVKAWIVGPTVQDPTRIISILSESEAS